MGKRLACEIGDQFGYWTVIDNIPEVRNTHRYVKVKCKCGVEDWRALSDLVSGKTTGCKSCKARERSIKISIGDRYKHWTVIDGPKTTEYQSIEWLVQCDCGNTRWIQPSELINPNYCFQCSKCAQKERGQKERIQNGGINNLTLTRFTKLQKSAKNRGYEFSITIPYLWDLFQEQKQCCAITGDYIANIEDASLDRIDSNKGYVVGNVQWVTKQANLSKHVMSMEQLYEFCKKVLNHANQQPSGGLTSTEGSETNGWNSNREYNTNTSAEYPEISG